MRHRRWPSSVVIYGSISSGSLGRLAITSLARSDSLDLVHVPCLAGGFHMNDALAGHLPLSIGPVFLTKPHLGSKRLGARALTTSLRKLHPPEVPTKAERGYVGFGTPTW